MVRVSYRGFHHTVRLPFSHKPTQLSREQATQICLEAFANDVKEDVSMLLSIEHVAMRDIAAGETFAAADVLEKASELDSQELVICPCMVPHSLLDRPLAETTADADGRCYSGVTRGILRELCDFLVSSAFGAVSGCSPSLVETGAEAQEGQAPARNLSLAPQVLDLQVLLLEICLTLAAVVAPRYGIPTGGNTVVHTPSDSSSVSRFDFVAPFLFTTYPRGLAAALLHPGSADGKNSASIASAGKAGGENLQGDAASAGGQLPPDPDSPESFISIALPPAPQDRVSLPFLSSMLEVLAELPGQEGGGSVPGARTRAEAFLVTLLNAIWLEPHAWSFSKPPKEVLLLLTGATSASAAHSLFSMPPGEKLSSSEERAVARAAASAAARLATRSLVLLLLLLFYETEAHPRVARAFAGLTDPLLEHAGHGALAQSVLTAPLNFPMLLHTVLGRLQQAHGSYALLFYALVHKNAGFRRFCICRDAAEVLLPVLEALHTAPATSQDKPQEVVPPWVMALLLCLISLTADKNLCESASRSELPDSGSVLGSLRPLSKVTVSSLAVIVCLRLGQWNFASCRDAFFHRGVAASLNNLARHSIENLHWSAASRTLELAQLLARNQLKDRSRQGEHAVPDRRRSVMISSLLSALVHLISRCLRLPSVIKNCSVVYALQRHYPDKFAQLEDDPDLGPQLRHIRGVTDWFESQCPALDCADDSLAQFARLEATASRLPVDVDALSNSVRDTRGFAYAETAGASAYFIPAVWRAAGQLLPPNICWTLPRAAGGA